jgi:hypothetical protein
MPSNEHSAVISLIDALYTIDAIIKVFTVYYTLYGQQYSWLEQAALQYKPIAT